MTNNQLKQILIKVRNGGFITPAISQILKLFEAEKCQHKWEDLSLIGYKEIKVVCNNCGKTLLEDN